MNISSYLFNISFYDYCKKQYHLPELKLQKISPKYKEGNIGGIHNYKSASYYIPILREKFKNESYDFSLSIINCYEITLKENEDEFYLFIFIGQDDASQELYHELTTSKVIKYKDIQMNIISIKEHKFDIELNNIEIEYIKNHDSALIYQIIKKSEDMFILYDLLGNKINLKEIFQELLITALFDMYQELY